MSINGQFIWTALLSVPWLDVVVAGAAIYATRQVGLFKEDYLVRNERAAKEKAIEYSREYMTSCVSAANEVFLCRHSKGLEMGYKGLIGDFSSGSLPKDHAQKVRKTLLDDHHLIQLYLNVFNSLQIVAAAFTTGVADEETGFEIIGEGFCATIANLYDALSLTRGSEFTYQYTNTIKLYQLWSVRFDRANVEEARKQARARAEELAAQEEAAKVSQIGKKPDRNHK